MRVEPGEGDEPIDCPPWLELDAIARVESDGGALDEQWPVTLRATQPDVLGFDGELSMAALSGTLAIDAGTGGPVEALRLSGTISEGGSFGEIRTRPTPSAGEAGERRVLRWPASEDCGAELSGAPLEADGVALGRSVAELRSTFAQPAPLFVTWNDGTQSGLGITAEPLTASCLRRQWWEPLTRVGHDARVHAESADGRWSGDYPGVVIVGGDGPAARRAELHAALDVPASERDRLGFSRLPDEPVDRLSLVLTLALDLQTGSAQGKVDVAGRRELECSDSGAPSRDQCVASSQVSFDTGLIED
jgi:hypothetical protein